MKKGVKFTLIVAIAIVALCLPYWTNDIACNIYKHNVEERLSQVSAVKPVEILHGCGNTAGTGDNTRLWVCVLIETDSAEVQFGDRFDDIWNIEGFEECNGKTFIMDMMNKNFSYSIDKSKNYFIIDFVKEAPFSWLDLRGS